MDPQTFPQILPTEMQPSVITLTAKSVPLPYKPKEGSIVRDFHLIEPLDQMQSLDELGLSRCEKDLCPLERGGTRTSKKLTDIPDIKR